MSTIAILGVCFGGGIAFAFGVGVGAFTMRAAQRGAMKEARDSFNEHQKRVEDRLAAYVHNTGRIATLLETHLNK